MKYFMQTSPSVPAAPPTPEMMEKMGAFMAEGFQTGTLVATGGMATAGTHVKAVDGKVTFTDLPLAEAKEAVVGWAIINAASEEEALEQCRRFWEIVGTGEGSVHRVYDPGEQPGQG